MTNSNQHGDSAADEVSFTALFLWLKPQILPQRISVLDCESLVDDKTHWGGVWEYTETEAVGRHRVLIGTLAKIRAEIKPGAVFLLMKVFLKVFLMIKRIEVESVSMLRLRLYVNVEWWAVLQPKVETGGLQDLNFTSFYNAGVNVMCDTSMLFGYSVWS